MNKSIERISFTVIILFALFGMMNIGTIVHEKEHERNLKALVLQNGEDYICLLEFPVNESVFKVWKYTGSYNYNLADNVTQEQLDETHTELKAYILDNITVGLLFMVCLFIVLMKRMENWFPEIPALPKDI